MAHFLLKLGVLAAVGGALFFAPAYDAHAAIDRTIAKANKRHTYIEYGTISGGESGAAFTLLNVRRIFSAKDKIERILLDLGDAYGKPLKGQVSYFQAAIEKENPRVVIDLSQMLASGVNEEAIKKSFKASPFVKEAKINFDPLDSTITIQLLLKKNMKLEAFMLPSKDKASRIAIDLKEKS
ncbi:MAG: hypothetical protein KDD38_01980 [Bdellovibrionales bacterium]|nr:hypothetical protein [Bdellovibrionales bacterium]